MKVCIACVNKNKLKYISEELKYIQHYISDLINEMSIVGENDDNVYTENFNLRLFTLWSDSNDMCKHWSVVLFTQKILISGYLLYALTNAKIETKYITSFGK